MKKILKYKARFLVLVMLLAVVDVPAMPTYARLSVLTIDSTSCESELDETLWSNVDGDVIGKDGILIFSDESTEATSLITKTTALKSEYTENLGYAEFTMNFTNLPEGEKFIFALGLQSIEATFGERGNIEIGFSNNGGLQLDVASYSDVDAPEVHLEATNCGSLKSKTKVVAKLKNSQELEVSVNGKQIFRGTVSVSGEGSLGFLQTGSCGVEISNFKLTSYKYDRPENCDFVEDFEEGIFNANLLTSKTNAATIYRPSYVQVEEYNGSNVLMFQNTGIGYIGTNYMYSNFELTFDVPFYQWEAVLDEDNKVLSPASDFIGVSFGAETVESTGHGFTSAKDLVLISGTGDVISYFNDYQSKGNLTDKKPFSVRVSVVDSVVSVGLKWMNQTEYKEVLAYEISDTPTGYVHIWAPSNTGGTFAIDNIKMVNKDEQANLVSVEFESAKMNVPEDYEYKAQGLTYNPDTTVEAEANMWYLPLVIVAGVCIMTLGVTAGVLLMKKRKNRKGEVADEKTNS